MFDILGREVSELVKGTREARVHEVRFDGSSLSSGVYFYRLQARLEEGGERGEYTETKRTLLLK